MTSVMSLGKHTEIDLNKIIVSGHSAGGATALQVGHDDARIAAVLCHDPWQDALGGLENFYQNLGDKPIHVAQTCVFLETVTKDSTFLRDLQSKHSNPEQFESIVIDKTAHAH